MTISFGPIIGIIAKRHSKPRLREFRANLQKRNIKQLTLYQYPAKTLFCIVLILVFAICLQWFAVELRTDLRNQELQAAQVTPTAHRHIDPLQIDQASFEQDRNENEELSASSEETLGRLRTIINFVHLLELISLIALTWNVNLRIVKTNKRDRVIEATNYSQLIFKTSRERYALEEEDKLQIWEMGESRFSNTNYYYSIRVINKQGSWEVIKKSNIYSSRTTVISLGFVHALPYSTRIIKVEHQQSP